MSRVGTYGSFLGAMLAGLSDPGRPPLAALRARRPTDPSVALLDAAATMLDVLTFYQERIANEGYLRTATDRRSLLELARLVGYRPRPGLAASAHLAFTVEQGHSLTIPVGTKVQSVPGQDELPLIFETGEPLEARAEWNQLPVRRTRPQLAPDVDAQGGPGAVVVWLKGTATGLRRGDPLLIEVSDEETPRVYRVHGVDVDRVADRTRVSLEPWSRSGLKRTVFESAGTLILLGGNIPGSITRDRVLASLRDLRDAAERADERKLLREIAEHALPSLEGELALLAPGATKLRPWLTQIVIELADAAAAATAMLSSAPPPAGGGFEFAAATLAASRAPTAERRTARQMPRELTAMLGARTAGTLAMIERLRPQLAGVVPALLTNARVAPPPALRVHALRVRASLFGNGAPPKFTGFDDHKKPTSEPWSTGDIDAAEDETVLHLDARYDAVLPGSWVVVDTSGVVPAKRGVAPDPSSVATGASAHDPRPAQFPLLVTRVVSVDAGGSRAAYGLTGPSTTISIAEEGADAPSWVIFPDKASDRDPTDAFDIIRRTTVLAGSEMLELAEAPIDEPLCGAAGANAIELSDLQAELRPGRWVIVSGERTDIPGTSGIMGAELRLIAGVLHDASRDAAGDILPGEQMHTFVTLATPLDNCYRRETVVVWGNVVGATHGETQNEVLGSGDSAQPAQRFTLRAAPLTYTAVPTAEGAASTLRLRVNEVLWHEVRSMAAVAPTEHVYVTSASNDAKTTVTVGGRGARLPTGRDNVRAVYRAGLGRAGNVEAGRLSLLGSRPLGLKEVVNPLCASGGADADSAEQIRRNAPLGLQALDRLVSLRDYADFARAFAGIGKATAARLSDGRRELVHVTIAGVDDAPILPSSDLFVNLQNAFDRLGDARQPVQLAVRELVLLVIGARVRVAPDYSWELVEPHVRAALLDALGFESRELGQPVVSSEVIGAIARVPGVAFVDLDTFGGIPEAVSLAGSPGVAASRSAITPEQIAELVAQRVGGTLPPGELCGWLPPFCPVRARLAGPDENGVLAPAQLAILAAGAPEMLALTAIP
jgi:uncharacterized phage protein gp47/JayE